MPGHDAMLPYASLDGDLDARGRLCSGGKSARRGRVSNSLVRQTSNGTLGCNCSDPAAMPPGERGLRGLLCSVIQPLGIVPPQMGFARQAGPWPRAAVWQRERVD